MLTAEELASLPVFPLPGLVFFPGSLLPLHIFEPRYRAMAAFCIEHEHPLAVGMIQAGQEHLQPGDPDVVALMGAGRIARAQELPDGRYNVVVAGLTRVRLGEELPLHEGFRRFSASAVEDLDERPAAARQALNTIQACVGGLATRQPAAARALSEVLERGLPPGPTSDCLAAVLFGDPEERQGLLVEADVSARLEHIAGRLVELL